MILTYNGVTLSDEMIGYLIKTAEQLNVPLSYLIVKLHFEGVWGQSSVAKTDNNWSGMSMSPSEYTLPSVTRPSGVVVTKGSARPANEGGFYYRYKSISDFLTDWTYLIRRGGSYKVADSNTFEEAVKGMFRYGGAAYDYATMNLPDNQRKERYEGYLKGMLARRKDINNANNGALDELDKGGLIMTRTARQVVDHAKTYLGTTEQSANFTKIINTYNGYRPLAQGVLMLRSWEWCACFVSFIAIELGIADLIGTEISVERYIENVFKKKGIWIEDGTITPQTGDIITWNWDENKQPNNGFADHIGFVDYVKDGYIYTVEGNTNERVGANKFKIGDGRIRGYARPKYQNAAVNEATKEHTTVKQHFVVQVDNLRAFDIPSGSGSIVENIKKNYVKNIDLIVDAEGYEWGGWISTNGKRRWTTLQTSDGSRKMVELRDGTIGHGGKTIQEYEASLKQEVKPAPNQGNRELKDNEFKMDGKIYQVKPA